MTTIPVNVDNFARAETHRTFAAIRREAGAIDRWSHDRAPTPIDHQPVIRQNRDTLYSAAVFDATSGVSFQVPDMGDRYASLMLINEDHYVTHVLHGAGSHTVPASGIGTPFSLVAARILVDASDPEDVTRVNSLQDRLVLDAPSARDFDALEYDQASLDETRTALLTLARGLSGFDRAFGRAEEAFPSVEPVG